jgi:hypothetical protein
MSLPKSDELIFATQYSSDDQGTVLRTFTARTSGVKNEELGSCNFTNGAVEVIGMGMMRSLDEPQILVRDDPNVVMLNAKCETTQRVQLDLRTSDHICVVRDRVHLLLQIFNHGNRLPADRLLTLAPDSDCRFQYFGITNEPVEASAYCYAKSYSVAVTRYITNESLYTNGIWLWKNSTLLDVEREQSTGQRLVYLDLTESLVSLIFAEEHGCIVRQYTIDPAIGLRLSVDGKTKLAIRKVAKNNDGYLVCTDRGILFVSSLGALTE